MRLIFAERAWDEYLYWQRSDKDMLKRVNALIQDIQRNGYDGIGKPEPLKHDYQGYWSRRIDEEHRLVYKIVNDELWIAKCRFHY